MKSTTITHPDNTQAFVDEKTAGPGILDLSVATLRKYRMNGGGPAYFKFNRAVRYRVSDLLEWAESRRVQP